MFLITAFIIHSCKKDNKTIPAITDPVINQAKVWYEGTYPANTLSKATAQSTNSVTNSIFDFSPHIKPDWQHPANYTRLGKNVIEMPVDPGTNFESELKDQTNRVYSNKKYNRTYFLLLNDGKSYQAYIMIIMADSAYVKNDIGKLAHNTYRKHDADFSGMVLYFTPKGQYVSGYAYKNGQLITPSLSAPASGNQKSQSINTGTSKLITNTFISVCTDWYLVTFINGIPVDYEYIGTSCDGEDGGGGGVVSGGSGGSASSPPPPPPCPPASSGTLNAVHLNINTAPAPPSGGGGDGGFPPPTTDPCTITTPAADTAILIDECAQKAIISAAAANPIVSTQNIIILTHTNTTGAEYGTNQNLTSWPGSAYVNTPVTTNGITNSWQPDFTWDSGHGYTIGFSHGHPSDTGPSPADAFSIVYPIGNSALINAGAAAVQYYKNNASVTTETTTGNYIVTVSNWTTIQSILNNSYNTDAEVATFKNNYQNQAQEYLNNNDNATVGDAGAYALMQLLPGAINVYYAPPGSTTYTPLVINSTTLSTIPCP